MHNSAFSPPVHPRPPSPVFSNPRQRIPLFLFLTLRRSLFSSTSLAHLERYTHTHTHTHTHTDLKMYRASAYMNNIADANTQDISNICEDRDYVRDLLPHLLITRICNFVNKSDLHSSLRHLAHPRFELIDPAHCPPFFAVPAKPTELRNPDTFWQLEQLKL